MMVAWRERGNRMGRESAGPGAGTHSHSDRSEPAIGSSISKAFVCKSKQCQHQRNGSITG